ncbi:MAG TPA: acetamidase/formamidase family protein [Blastocatellia bacterium]|nr:acetamidase/formamidase family protein [Blastocatellia bacterium]
MKPRKNIGGRTHFKQLFYPVLSLTILAITASAISAQTRRFTPTVGYPTFAKREPVLRVKPGEIIETNSLWGDWYERAGGAWPGEVGPFYIEGATPNDTLVVKILKLRPNRDTAVSTHTPNFSALANDKYTPVLNDPIPAKRFIWRLDRARNTGTLELPQSRLKKIEVTLAPMLGRVAVAPVGEQSWGGLWPGDFGGNMDASDVCEGATVYLPIFHDGALFYFGDGHALQGDGEVCGSGLETSMDVTFQFDLIKNKKIRWPRIENSEFIMATGSVRPLMDAFRIAQIELINWLVEEYGFDKWEALQVVSQTGQTRVANAVDPNYTVVAKFPKKYLPKN